MIMKDKNNSVLAAITHPLIKGELRREVKRGYFRVTFNYNLKPLSHISK